MEEANYMAKSLKLLGSYLICNRRSEDKMFVFWETISSKNLCRLMTMKK
jgi:hypothetical protein